MPNNPQNVITNHIEDLEEINPLPELMKYLQLTQKTKRIQDKDYHFGINILPDCVFNRGKQSFTRSSEENDFPNNHDQQKPIQPHTVPVLNLGSLYDCSEPQHLVIFGSSLLRNFSDSILQ